jgi:hypothetical protein
MQVNPKTSQLSDIRIATDVFGMWNFSQRRQAQSGTSFFHLRPTQELIALVTRHDGETNMTIRKILAAVTAVSLIALPAMAQTSTDAEKNGHH